MGREERDLKKDRMRVLETVRGHDSTIAHSFNHTEGACPKCGCKEQGMFFCAPDVTLLPKIRGCELDGEHLHRMCAACRYPWVERCMDQAMLAEQQGDMTAESEIAAALAAIAHRHKGLRVERGLLASYRGWVIHFHRDEESGNLVVTSSAPEPQKGDIVHPKPEDMAVSQG